MESHSSWNHSSRLVAPGGTVSCQRASTPSVPTASNTAVPVPTIGVSTAPGPPSTCSRAPRRGGPGVETVATQRSATVNAASPLEESATNGPPGTPRLVASSTVAVTGAAPGLVNDASVRRRLAVWSAWCCTVTVRPDIVTPAPVTVSRSGVVTRSAAAGA